MRLDYIHMYQVNVQESADAVQNFRYTFKFFFAFVMRGVSKAVIHRSDDRPDVALIVTFSDDAFLLHYKLVF